MLTPSNYDPFLRLPQVRELTGRSTASIYRDMKLGRFPRPVAIGRNSRAWRMSEVAAWQAQIVAARDSGEDVTLRAVNPHIGRGRRRHESDQHAA